MENTPENQAEEAKFSKADVEKMIEKALAEKEAPMEDPNRAGAAEVRSSRKRRRRQDYEQDDGQQTQYRPRRSSCAHLIVLAFAMLACVFGSVYYLVSRVAAPVMNYADSLPKDFPAIKLYQPDRAKVSIDTPQAKAQIAELINSVPSWALAPFASKLSSDIKTQVAAALPSGQAGMSEADLNQLKSALASAASTTGVTFKWDEINKSKEDLAQYYERELKSSGYEVARNALGGEIDLRFIKEGISGAMTIADSFLKDGASVMNMTVNY